MTLETVQSGSLKHQIVARFLPLKYENLKPWFVQTIVIAHHSKSIKDLSNRIETTVQWNKQWSWIGKRKKRGFYWPCAIISKLNHINYSRWYLLFTIKLIRVRRHRSTVKNSGLPSKYITQWSSTKWGVALNKSSNTDLKSGLAKCVECFIQGLPIIIACKNTIA